MKNRYLSFIGAVCLVSICFALLLCPTIAFSLPEDCAVLGADDSTAQLTRDPVGPSDGDRSPSDSVSFTASIDLSIYEYTGDAIAPRVSVLSDSGFMLTCGTDYEVSYANNIAPGCAAIDVNGLGDYADVSVRLSFQIVRSSDSKIALPGSWAYQNGKWWWRYEAGGWPSDCFLTIGGAE